MRQKPTPKPSNAVKKREGVFKRLKSKDIVWNNVLHCQSPKCYKLFPYDVALQDQKRNEMIDKKNRQKKCECSVSSNKTGMKTEYVLDVMKQFQIGVVRPMRKKESRKKSLSEKRIKQGEASESAAQIVKEEEAIPLQQLGEQQARANVVIEELNVIGEDIDVGHEEKEDEDLEFFNRSPYVSESESSEEEQ
ncbi:hypothetical protein CAEBREN_24498 [Caenorhabditis brenneri]|uniref:Uncharacterized protein n=1 Tax=Caenorhabditis brenneri TaxID=135651 RepID=G0M8I7_CAEBE|nr:hypothetical protein CAEBREN_24498 [Caenorhabditis brenneri]